MNEKRKITVIERAGLETGSQQRMMGESMLPPPLGKTASMPASTMLQTLDVCSIPPPSRAQSTTHGGRINSASSGPTEKEQRELGSLTPKTPCGRKLHVVVLIDHKVAKHQKVRELAWAELLKIADCLNINLNVRFLFLGHFLTRGTVLPFSRPVAAEVSQYFRLNIRVETGDSGTFAVFPQPKSLLYNINSPPLQRIEFDRLDFGETSALDAFYNADIALVDISIRQQVPSLCYHIGVRESMGQAYNILLRHCNEDFMETHKLDLMEALKVCPYSRNSWDVQAKKQCRALQRKGSIRYN